MTHETFSLFLSVDQNPSEEGLCLGDKRAVVQWTQTGFDPNDRESAIPPSRYAHAMVFISIQVKYTWGISIFRKTENT